MISKKSTLKLIMVRIKEERELLRSLCLILVLIKLIKPIRLLRGSSHHGEQHQEIKAKTKAI